MIFNALRARRPAAAWATTASWSSFLPFTFKVCGSSYESVFVNANGSLSFGARQRRLLGDDATSSCAGPPRVAGLCDDLNPAAGGTVSFEQSSDTFTVTWEGVPEFPASGANTFSITLKRSANHAEVEYGALSATDGLAGLSCGGKVTSGFENEEDLVSRHGHHGHGGRTINLNGETAAFEIFTAADNDLADAELKYVNFKRGFDDAFEGNNSIARARRIQLPFDTASLHKFSEIAPGAATSTSTASR